MSRARRIEKQCRSRCSRLPVQWWRWAVRATRTVLMLSFLPKLRLYWGEIVCTGTDLVLGGKTKTWAWFPSPGVSEAASVGTAMMGNGVGTCPLDSVLKNYSNLLKSRLSRNIQLERTLRCIRLSPLLPKKSSRERGQGVNFYPTVKLCETTTF